MSTDIERGRNEIGVQGAFMGKVKEAARATDSYVRENPWKMAGVAATAGLVVGVLLQALAGPRAAVDFWDTLLCAVLAVFAPSAAWGWRECYEWFVEPAKHHQPPSALSPSNPWSSQEGCSAKAT